MSLCSHLFFRLLFHSYAYLCCTTLFIPSHFISFQNKIFNKIFSLVFANAFRLPLFLNLCLITSCHLLISFCWLLEMCANQKMDVPSLSFFAHISTFILHVPFITYSYQIFTIRVQYFTTVFLTVTSYCLRPHPIQQKPLLQI